MKRPQNQVIVTVKKGKVVRKNAALQSPVPKHHRIVGPALRGAGYSDGLIRVYKQEEEDINRFAAFAKTLMPR